MGLDSHETQAEQLAQALAIEDEHPCPEATAHVRKVAGPLIANADDWTEFNTNPSEFAGCTVAEEK
ncbi:MAG: hypothetical protein CL969_00235 [Euryarchaeota archaeon]|jgi:hypothetical protein|nr:hypothetical protein [Euryarchaeota archaeon]MDP6575197.1 hypothetical protein [Candidatus Peribacteraceae bacterium]HCI03658.1 hypothetical protein [Candidatus Peribacteria bacterium]|tara:strand:+ start:8738 stop:8935 length:198 start_codon:yes stop_codon:yes gene_type:complete